LDKYDELFSPIKSTAKLVVEIGVHKGGSIKLWDDYFEQAKVIGMDTTPPSHHYSSVDLSSPTIEIRICDAYTEAVSSFIKDADVIIDDGPHTLASQLKFLELYSSSVKVGGRLIIEDIQNPDTEIEMLRQATPTGFTLEVDDRRNVKGRYDDVLMIYTKQEIQ
jgi:cephalosporin hydroxylase